MSKNKKIVYPVTKETLHEYAKSIFAPVIRGENVTTVWVPMAGRRMWSKFIIENIELFEKELPNYNQYILVYVEPLDLTEESLAGYLRLIANSFVEASRTHLELRKEVDKEDLSALDDEKASYPRMLSTLQSLLMTVSKAKHEVVLFLGEFDELNFANKIFYHNLKSLWSRLYPALHYVFLMRERITREENILSWGELTEVILQNQLYVPLLSSDDTDDVLEKFSKEYNLKLTPKEKDIFIDLCGGHPYLLKVCFRVLSRNKGEKIDNLEKTLREYYETKSVAKGILNVRSSKEKDVLRGLVRGKLPQGEDGKDMVLFMERLGLVKKLSDGKYKLFGKLFKDALKNGKAIKSEKTSEKNLLIDPKSGAILHGGVTVEEKFTRQEYAILHMFLENIGVLKSRDDIGDVLWGKEAYEKYSDWAIDQVISKLRKKIGEMNAGVLLHTIRGKGYKLTTA